MCGVTQTKNCSFDENEVNKNTRPNFNNRLFRERKKMIQSSNP